MLNLVSPLSMQISREFDDGPAFTASSAADSHKCNNTGTSTVTFTLPHTPLLSLAVSQLSFCYYFISHCPLHCHSLTLVHKQMSPCHYWPSVKNVQCLRYSRSTFEINRLFLYFHIVIYVHLYLTEMSNVQV